MYLSRSNLFLSLFDLNLKTFVLWMFSDDALYHEMCSWGNSIRKQFYEWIYCIAILEGKNVIHVGMLMLIMKFWVWIMTFGYKVLNIWGVFLFCSFCFVFSLWTWKLNKMLRKLIYLYILVCITLGMSHFSLFKQKMFFYLDIVQYKTDYKNL